MRAPGTVQGVFRRSSSDLLPAFRLLAAGCALMLAAYFIYIVVSGIEPLGTVVASAALCLFFFIFLYLCLNPDILRSQYTERTLAVAADMLEDLKDGLTPRSAEQLCRRLLPETKAMAIAVTNDEIVLACAGELADDFPPGSVIHTPATRYVIEHGLAQSFTQVVDVQGERGRRWHIPAGIIVPIKVRDTTVGTLKFYYRRASDVNRTQYALASGFGGLVSSQLANHELELQEALTARAELRALQAQINPHFLFNTLNTIAALTRTEPLRARGLLREFASFYRATLDNSGSLIPVAREVEQTERYLLFEKARFGEDRIVEAVRVDEGAEDFLVPAFIIQPLVENAVRHAMPDEGPLHIGVTVCHDGGQSISIEVSDDGVGMKPEVAARLFDAKEQAPDPSAPPGGGAGVAMHNISERVKRFYGPGSYARVSSRPGEGTSIVLHLDVEGSSYARE